MKILVDAFPFLLRSAGVKTALYEWTRALAAIEGIHCVQCFPWLQLPPSIDHQRSPLPRLNTFARLLYVHLFNKMPAAVRNVATARADLFHISIHLRQPPTRMPISTTIHDMTCWVVPETHMPANVAANKAFAEHVYPMARGLLAVSEATRKDACRLLRLSEDKVEVVPNGIAPHYFDVSDSEGERVRKALNLPEQFVLCAGTIEPRKNIVRLLNAWDALPPSRKEGWELVLAGPIGWADTQTIHRVKNSNSVRYLGYVPETDFPGLFRAASVLAYPSLYEGFGLPPAQALAMRVPVLTSNISSLPEVCGDGAVYVDPYSESEIRNGLEQLIGNDELRRQLGSAGRRHVQQFTWENAAIKSLRFFERILA